MAKWWLGVALVVGCAACGSSESTTPLTSSSVSADPTDGTRPVIDWTPPVVVVRAGASRVEITATRWSGEIFAADGTRPARPVEVGPSTELVVEYARPEMVFEASLIPIDGGPVLTKAMSKVDATMFRLDSIGHAGVFDVVLFGQSPTGAVEVWVRWNATT